MKTTPKILAVDDTPENLKLLDAILTPRGYELVTAANGTAALEVIGRVKPDLVLLDIVMPGLDGFGVLETIKGDSRLWDIPVIMISSVDETASIVRCLDMGAVDFVSKPFDPVILRAKLNSCLARKRFHDLEVEYQRIVKEQAARTDEMNRDLARRAREAARRVRLQRFLPAPVADQLASSGDTTGLDPHRQDVCVVAARLFGLGAGAEDQDPDSVFAVVRDFHAAVGELAATFEGTVVAVTSQNITVVFNDPRWDTDPAAKGLRMTGALSEALTPLTGRWRETHGLDLHWGAGVALGVAALGLVEVDGRCDYWAVGSAVDRAGVLADQARDAVAVDESLGVPRAHEPAD